jgi:hypothetical protein
MTARVHYLIAVRVAGQTLQGIAVQITLLTMYEIILCTVRQGLLPTMIRIAPMTTD